MKGDDGFLVRDINGNGQIDSVAEMFGDNGGTTAYAKLDALDTSSPSGNVLNSSDAAWSTLRVWQDANENGRVDSGELKTLSSLNITSINTNPTNDTILGGQPIAGQSTFTMNGNPNRVAADVLFETDQLNSWYVGNGTPGDTDIDLDTLILPLSRGYGSLPSLHYAMTDDAALKTMVEDFATLDIADIDEIYDRIDAIVLRWADADGVAANSRGIYADGANLAVLETITDDDFYSVYAGANPNDISAGVVGHAYALLVNEMLERFLVQGPLSNVFTKATYSFADDKLELNDTLSNIIANATASQPSPGAAHTIYWNEISKIINHYHDDLGVTAPVAKNAVDAAAGFNTAPVTVFGTSGNDLLGSDGTSDVIRGGAGNDTIYADGGDDIYVFGSEGGNDVIAHRSLSFANGSDAIRFETINAANVSLNKSGNDLIITASGIGETITVKDHYDQDAFAIREIQFANGEIWNQSTIEAVANGGSAVATLAGTSGNDTLTATSTTINMKGGAGADTFVINQSSSKFITITDFNAAEGDVIDITAFTGTTGYNSHMNPLQKAGHGSFSLYTPTGDIKLNISGHDIDDMAPHNFRSDNLYYGRGQSIGGTSGADTISATVANDTIYGNEGNDSIYANVGHDVVYGWTGNDTINGYQGNDLIGGDDGDDLIDGGDDEDTLYGGNGLDTIRGGYGHDVIVGDAGNDSLMGEDGNDTLDGGAGNDTMKGGVGNDVYYVDAASDVVTENGSEGNDTVVSSLASYTLGSNVENLTVDTLGGNAIGNGLSNVLRGNAVGNSMHGLVGADTLYGLAGDDTLAGNEDGDLIDGGDGIDRLFYEYSNGGVTVNLGTGSVSGGHATGDTILGIEYVSGSLSYADNITGDAGANALWGHGGNDTLNGGDGNDTLEGGDGNDSLIGGSGQDMAFYGNSNAGININLGSGTASGGHAAGDTLSGIEIIGGSSYADAIAGDGLANYLNGSGGNDTLYGADGNDTMVGGAGADNLNGGNGTDMLDYSASSMAVYVNLQGGNGNLSAVGSDAYGDVYVSIEDVYGSNLADTFAGGSGNNLIYGNGGNDFINGFTGNDTLHGGAGDDTFFFWNNHGADVILDFQGAGVAGGDTISLYQTGYANFAALQSIISYSGGNATITFSAGNAITVVGVTSFISSDFVFTP